MKTPKNNTLILIILATAGVAAIGYYVSWWAVDERYRSPLLLLVLAAALTYIILQLAANWILNLVATQAQQPEPESNGFSVDVFITAYHEPVEMVRFALAAALRLKGSPKVYLLDDGRDPELRALAEKMGCGYLTREGNSDAKAGNVNEAMKHTSGDIIAIFDIDHVPNPDFLKKSLGYFKDPRMGFVQVMLTFRNFEESWVARAAMESSLEFYNPTYLGANRLGAATLMGSNALIRRKALEAIGGYRPGLAEDLATSIALHYGGWSSAYVAEPLAPGLSPSSMAAWSIQQLKWARGVFELLITAYPKKFRKLSHGQRLSYAVRMTKYWIGPAVFVHLAATILILFFGTAATRGAFHEYLLHIGPLLGVDALIRAYTLRSHRHADLPPSSLLGAVVLIYASWPIYLLAWTLAVLRFPVKFMPTPKDTHQRLRFVWLLPQFISMVLLLGGMLYTSLALNHPLSALLAFASGQAVIQFLLLLRWAQADLLVRVPRSRKPVSSR